LILPLSVFCSHVPQRARIHSPLKGTHSGAHF
jgi:hypothetical protein